MAKKKTPAKKSNPPKKPAAKKAAPKRGLGRGLSALMDDVNMDSIISDDVLIVDDISDMPDPQQDAGKSVGTKIDTSIPVGTKIETKSGDPFGRTPEQVAYDDAAIEKLKEDMANDPLLKAHTERKAREEAAKPKAPPAGHNVSSGVIFVEMGQLERNPEQPRRFFDRQMLDELADSIRQKGILQPILVRSLPGKEKRNKPTFQIVAGERRWQAAMMAKLDSMPVFVREITDQEALEIGVIENVQRAELNPMEEALAYKALIMQFGRTQDDVASAVGKSRSYISNMMRLINLPDDVQDFLSRGAISIGHARAIIAAPDPSELANAIVDNDLTVRDAEDWARKLKTAQVKPVAKPANMKAADTRRLEAQIMDALGLAVDLRHRGPNGELRIKYKTGDQLDDVVARLVREK